MKKLLLPVICAAGLLCSCGGGDEGRDLEVAVPVSVEEIRPGSIEEFVVATGSVRAEMEAALKVETAGEYRRMTNPATGKPYALGDRVRTGAEIIRIVNEEAENTIRIDAALLTLETRRLEYEKQQTLHEKGGITYGELKDAERAFINAQYDYENAKISLAKLRVSAPFEGIITSLPYYSPGVTVETGKELAVIQEYSGLQLQASLPGKELGRVRPGQPVRVTNYTVPDDTLSGTVEEVSPALDETTRSFPVSIGIDNGDLLLRPGMFVRAEIVVARHDSVIVIPKSVIQVKQRGKTVFIVQKGAALERIITTGLENPERVEVVEGLALSDRLVVRGFETLRGNSRVKVVQ
ncbi:MAG: efflux RND transporter periplasmic adaptor subunit [Candidatus Krumholzibacteria bacterium]|nr:efflux RND transporter periplasmic adaptor subunit [Candidatus Krumholzibacteria bacterium]